MEPTEQQRLNAIQAAGLTANQVANVNMGTPTGQTGLAYSAQNTINSDVLNPISQINLPAKPQDPTDYLSIVKGIDAENKALSTPTDTAEKDSTLSLFEKYLGSSTPPPSITGQYETAYKDMGIQELETAGLEKQKVLKTAQGKLANINAQLAGLSAEATAVPVQIQKEFEGRGVTAGGVAPIERSRLRDIALRALPLQAQAIAAQAEVQSAQGDVELAQNTLKMAQDRMATVFQLKTKDAEMTYNHQKDIRDRVYDFLSASEKRRLDAMQKQDDRAFEMAKAEFVANRDLANTAIENGQASLAAQLSALDPNSETYQTDKAALVAQMRPDMLDRQIKEAQLAIYRKEAAPTGNDAPITLTPTAKTSLLGAGFTPTEVSQISTSVNTNGIKATLLAIDNTEQRRIVAKQYGAETILDEVETELAPKEDTTPWWTKWFGIGK